LADYLWARYDLESQVDAMFRDALLLMEQDGDQTEIERDHEHELEWVRESFPSEVTDVSETLETTLRTIAPLLQALEVQVDYEPQTDLPPVTGQRVLLGQALINLFTAAVHTVPQGSVHVTVEAQNKGIVVCVRAMGGDAPTLATGDSGAEHLQMARRVAQAFGGILEIAPSGATASSFAATLVLPITERMRVLVVDDNADTLRLIQRYLAGTRYQFVGVTDPAEALSMAESLAPQAIVLDVMLPGIDGWELLGRLREHPATRTVPVVVCTIMPQERLALTLGAAGYIRKPISREALLSVLDQEAKPHERGYG
jgi:CheY-like chemotaxis protein